MNCNEAHLSAYLCTSPIDAVACHLCKRGYLYAYLLHTTQIGLLIINKRVTRSVSMCQTYIMCFQRHSLKLLLFFRYFSEKRRNIFITRREGKNYEWKNITRICVRCPCVLRLNSGFCSNATNTFSHSQKITESKYTRKVLKTIRLATKRKEIERKRTAYSRMSRYARLHRLKANGIN